MCAVIYREQSKPVLERKQESGSGKNADFNSYPYDYLINEAESLVSRLKQVKPFAMTMPMVRAASVSTTALNAIMDLLESGKEKLYESIDAFIKKVNQAKQQRSGASILQTEFTIQKLRYNSILDQLDIFADVLSQRSEHDTGIWLAGLDVLAEDGLRIGEGYFEIPSLMVFRARTWRCHPKGTHKITGWR
jgi:hypothetical protein